MRRRVAFLVSASLVSAAVAATVMTDPVVTAASAATRHGLARCGQSTVGGATVITHCGPAKVTFTFGGRTYRIYGGSCSVAAGFWTLLAGRQTLPRAKPRFTSFQAGLVGTPKARTYTKADLTLSFEIPGERWSLALGVPHRVAVSAGGRKGAFTGTFFTGNKAGTRPAKGSWTC